jgi:carbon-monoxide dehydrogenase iron sulfur subunit
MACALSHWGSVTPTLSAIIWYEGNSFYGLNGRYPLFCQQCSHPECYYACPAGEKAFKIDIDAGITYINHEECTGCGRCIKACPFEIKRINFDGKERVAIKCDLCREKESGPVCVDVCDRGALTLVERRRR